MAEIAEREPTGGEAPEKPTNGETVEKALESVDETGISGEIFQDTLDSFDRRYVQSEKNLGFRDKYATDEQNMRDKQITRLLEAYVDTYEDKVRKNKEYRSNILWTCITITVLFAIVLALLPFQVFGGDMEAGDVVSFATACVSFLTLIVGLLHIVTKYVFPENDEEYITRIVEMIQTNDLKNKQENAKNSRSGGGGGSSRTEGNPLRLAVELVDSRRNGSGED
jgi:hypothetical protein